MYVKLYAGNLLFEITNQELRELFEAQGCEVLEARVFYDDRNGHSRGFAAIRISKDTLDAALALHDFEYRGRRLLIRPWTESARYAQPRWNEKL